MLKASGRGRRRAKSRWVFGAICAVSFFRPPQEWYPEGDRFFKRATRALNLFVKAFQSLIQAINLGQEFGQDEPVMRLDTVFQVLGQFCHDRWVAMPFQQRGEHRLPRNSHDIRSDRGQFDVCTLQGLLHAVHQVRLLPHKVAALASQFPQITLFHWWNEARTHEAVAQQVRQPLRILDIGLATRNRFDVPGIHQPDFKVAFENVKGDDSAA